MGYLIVVLICFIIVAWIVQRFRASPTGAELFRWYRARHAATRRWWQRNEFQFDYHGMRVVLRWRTTPIGTVLRLYAPGLSRTGGPLRISTKENSPPGCRYELPSSMAGGKRIWTNLRPEDRGNWDRRIVWEVTRLFHLPNAHSPSIDCNHRSSSFQARFQHAVPSQWNDWISSSLSVFEALYVVDQREMQFVSRLESKPREVESLNSAEPVEAQPVCGICGASIGDDPVYCRKCQTVHHRDCWDFNGRCSVFGCGETQIRDSATRLYIARDQGGR